MEEALAHMKAAEYEKAVEAYDTVLSGGKVDSIWTVLAQTDALRRCERYHEAFECLAQIVKVKGVLGNPLFHLLAGLVKFGSIGELGSGPGAPSDEFARALMGGGIEMFNEESDIIITKIKKLMKPPQGYNSWEETANTGGASSDLLIGATGWCKCLLKQKNVFIPENTQN